VSGESSHLVISLIWLIWLIWSSSINRASDQSRRGGFGDRSASAASSASSFSRPTTDCRLLSRAKAVFFKFGGSGASERAAASLLISSALGPRSHPQPRQPHAWQRYVRFPVISLRHLSHRDLERER
jgi:hypothetical protein